MNDPAGGDARPARGRGRVIALLGAESTGKTTLAADLGDAIVAAALVPASRIAIVPEVLRGFCDLHGRTPRPDEQAGIAAEQARRIDAAAATHDLVLADTTALMTAVYSEQVFGDRGLYPVAEAAQAGVDLVLLTALDLPWRADGLQRDGPQVREPVDALLRAALDRVGRPYALVHGQGPARTAAALAAVRPWLGGASAVPAPAGPMPGRAGWQHLCDRCDDPACEHRSALTGALGRVSDASLSDARRTPAAADPPA